MSGNDGFDAGGGDAADDPGMRGRRAVVPRRGAGLAGGTGTSYTMNSIAHRTFTTPAADVRRARGWFSRDRATAGEIVSQVERRIDLGAAVSRRGNGK